MSPHVGEPWFLKRSNLLVLAAISFVLYGTSHAQTVNASVRNGDVLTITKIDPPNWYATFPEPMLLVHGEGLRGAQFSLSDASLRIQRAQTSENGHWAQLWLKASPSRAETVQLQVRRGSAHVEQPYRFEQRRAPGSGMAGFSARDVMYLVLTDRFADGDPNNDGPLARDKALSPAAAAERAKPKGWHGGDLRGIEQRLPYLQSLGVTAVWPTPVYQNHGPEAYHGYHATDYYAVDEHYGSLADLQSLAEALHKHGMKLVLDTVPNHVGPFHPWVSDEPDPDWFHGTAQHHIPAEFNFDALVNPHAPERDRTGTLHGWFVDALPDMNTENPAVAQYLRQNAVWWIEQTGADALRIDTFPYVDRAFWHDFTGELRTLFPHVTEVGEVSNGDPEIVSAFADGVTRAGVDTGLYTPFDFPMYHAARDVFAAGEPFTRLSRVLESDDLYPHPERLVPFLGNHDETRFAQVVSDPALQEIAYLFLMAGRGTPQLYAGDEIAMLGAEDPDNRRDFPGGFPGDTLDDFLPAMRTAQQQHLFAEISALAVLRAKHPALACGSEQILQAGKDVLVWSRLAADTCGEAGPNPTHERLLVVIQRGTSTPIHVDLKNTDLANCHLGKPLFGQADATMSQEQLQIQAHSGGVILPCD